MSRDTGKSIVFDILAVTSKCGVVDTLQLEYPLPEDTSVVREYQGSIWRSSWTDLIAFWGVIAMCAILMIFALAPLVSHIIRERLERRQLMASVVMTESSSWNRRSSRVYSETAL
jgi:MFS-type transporter involved in bile tolerance (Atg22 family)